MNEESSVESVKPAPIPVTVVAGFLGAGKTTLINHILTGGHGRRIAVVVNDFGSINIDAELISDVGDGMVSLANGCICCVIRNDLISAVLKLAERAEPPDHIVIESSGVAEPASLVKAFSVPEIQSTVLLDGVISLVDAEQALTLPDEVRELARNQITGGDLIVLNKTDLAGAETLAKVREWIVDLRPGAQVLEAVHCDLPLEILLGVHAKDSGRVISSSDHNHHPDQVFETWSYESDRPLQLGYLQGLLRRLPNTVYRAKGFIYSSDKPHRRLVLQMVGRRAVIAVAAPWEDDKPQTRLVFVAGAETINFSALGKALEACVE